MCLFGYLCGRVCGLRGCAEARPSTTRLAAQPLQVQVERFTYVTSVESAARERTRREQTFTSPDPPPLPRHSFIESVFIFSLFFPPARTASALFLSPSILRRAHLPPPRCESYFISILHITVMCTFSISRVFPIPLGKCLLPIFTKRIYLTAKMIILLSTSYYVNNYVYLSCKFNANLPRNINLT
jgi:hypothetical protein